MAAVLVLLGVLLINIPYSLCESTVQEFHVKPTGDNLEFVHEFEGAKCRFKYQATGGTHEGWHMIIDVEQGERIMCSVFRGQTSYLYFDHFSLDLSGSHVGELHDDHEAVNTGTTALAPTEYKMDKENAAFLSSDGFQHHLEKVTILTSYSTTPKSSKPTKSTKPKRKTDL